MSEVLPITEEALARHSDLKIGETQAIVRALAAGCESSTPTVADASRKTLDFFSQELCKEDAKNILVPRAPAPVASVQREVKQGEGRNLVVEVKEDSKDEEGEVKNDEESQSDSDSDSDDENRSDDAQEEKKPEVKEEAPALVPRARSRSRSPRRARRTPSRSRSRRRSPSRERVTSSGRVIKPRASAPRSRSRDRRSRSRSRESRFPTVVYKCRACVRAYSSTRPDTLCLHCKMEPLWHRWQEADKCSTGLRVQEDMMNDDDAKNHPHAPRPRTPCEIQRRRELFIQRIEAGKFAERLRIYDRDVEAALTRLEREMRRR